MKVLVAKSCWTLCDPIDCNPPGSSVHGILQARILEWVVIPFSRGSSRPRDQTHVSCIGRRVVYCLSHQGRPFRCRESKTHPGARPAWSSSYCNWLKKTSYYGIIFLLLLEPLAWFFSWEYDGAPSSKSFGQNYLWGSLLWQLRGCHPIHGATGTTLSDVRKGHYCSHWTSERVVNPLGSMKNVCPHAQEYLPALCPLYVRFIKELS